MPRRRADPRQNGFALVAALWLLLILGILGSSFLRDVRSERALVTSRVTLVQARLAADAGIRRAILSLLDTQDRERWRIDGASRTIALLGQACDVAVGSEAGKIDLNLAPADLLAALFRTQQVAPAEADDLAARIVEWRRAVPDGEPDDTLDPYVAAHRRYGPRHGPFRSIDELRLVIGMSDELQAAVEPLVTVYSRTPTVRRQAASDQVLAVLAEAGDNLAGIQRDAMARGAAVGADERPAQGEAIEIRARSEVGGLRVVRTAVIRLTGDRREPYWILSWR